MTLTTLNLTLTTRKKKTKWNWNLELLEVLLPVWYWCITAPKPLQ